ncbi:MAG: MFS transporter [Planctomycetaceae bacterium]|nr:MFS transporter [Planctomycetaceae bacterium]
MSLLNDIGSEMLAPLLPEFVIGVLKGTKAQLGLIDGVGESIASLLKLWAGGASDRAGSRKAFVVVGYYVAVLARPLMALAGAPWHVFVLRAIDRTGKGIRTAPRDALIADSTPREQHGRAFGFHRSMDHLGAALGPLFAFAFMWLFPDQLRWLFFLAIVPGIPILFLVAMGVHDSHRGPHAPREESVSRSETTTMSFSLAPFPLRFRLYLLVLLIFTLGNSSDSFLLVRAKELGISVVWLPILWLVFHLAKSGGNFLCGGCVDRFGPRPLILAGWLLYAAVYVAFGFAASAWHAWLLFLAYAGFYALTEPAEKALVAAIVGPEHKGLAFGWFSLTIGIAALPASLLFGWIYDGWGALAAFGTGAAFALAAAALLAAGFFPLASRASIPDNATGN